MLWLAQAPANIALIKYMGKKQGQSNLPTNASLSYTLNNLLSTVKLEPLSSKKDVWEPLNIPGAADFKLSKEAQQRFIDHLERIKKHYNYVGGFLIQSSNNFPHSSGLASSASSFAALTKCACLALSEMTSKLIPSLDEQAQLSRLGSGSSCRSFYSPWAIWRGDAASALELPYTNLIHQVIIISNQEKKVSSSEAHQRVQTSPLFEQRGERAEDNLKSLLAAFETKNWPDIYEICWREFQDMHELFKTCKEPFTYMNNNSLNVLKLLQQHWQEQKDGPIVTMDAGPNIHLLYRQDQKDQAHHFKVKYLLGNYDVL